WAGTGAGLASGFSATTGLGRSVTVVGRPGAGASASASTTASCGLSRPPNWLMAMSAAGMATTSRAPAQARPLVIRRSIGIETNFQHAPPERGDMTLFRGHNMNAAAESGHAYLNTG